MESGMEMAMVSVLQQVPRKRRIIERRTRQLAAEISRRSFRTFLCHLPVLLSKI
jgi:hypothetical protein